MARLKFGRYDYAAFWMFIAYAVASVAVPVVLVNMARDLHFALEEEGGMVAGGWLQMLRSVSVCVAMALCVFLSARYGNRRPLGFATVLIGVGMLCCVIAPNYAVLIVALAFAGFGEGVIEGLATPFVQENHHEEPGRYINFSHGFWSVGVLVATLLFGFMLVQGVSWRWVLVVAGLFAVPGLWLALVKSRRASLPPSELHSTSVPAREIFRRAAEAAKLPRFWLFYGAMFLAGGGEFCLTFWVASFIQLNFAGSAMLGGAGTAIFALGMFLGRIGSGFLVPHKYLRHLIVAMGIFATAVSAVIPHLGTLTPNASNASILILFFIVLFLAGIGTAPFWPSIQSYAVDCLPKLDTTMLFVLLSCAGIPGCGFFTLLMGYVGNAWGLAVSFYLVPACFAVMTGLVFLASVKKGHQYPVGIKAR